MSYSFNFRAATVALASAAIAARLDEVVATQPIHEADRAQAEAAANAFVGTLGEPAEGQELAVSVCGWVSKTNDTLTGASVTVTANHVAIEAT